MAQGRAGQSLEMERYNKFGVEREGTGTRGSRYTSGRRVLGHRGESKKPKGKGVESVWLNVKKRGMPYTLVGVLYITPQEEI